MINQGFNQKNFTKSDANQADFLKNQLKSSINKKNKIEEKTNKELLDVFLNDRNSMHIDKVAEFIKSKRKEQGFEKNKVNVIQGVSTNVTYNTNSLQRKDHEDVYKRYEQVSSNNSLGNEEREKELSKIDNLLAARAVLMTESKSIQYVFKRRAYFGEESSRDYVFGELNKVEPFKGKIIKKTYKLNKLDYYFIQWKDEVRKNTESRGDKNKDIDKNKKRNDPYGDKIEITNNVNVDISSLTSAIAELSSKLGQQNMVGPIATNVPTLGYIQQHYPMFYNLMGNAGIPGYNVNNNHNQVNPTISNAIGGLDNASNNLQLIAMIEKMLENLQLKLENKFEEKYNKFAEKISKLKTLDVEEIKNLMEIELNKVRLHISDNMEEKLEETKKKFLEKIEKIEDKYDKKLEDIRKNFMEKFDTLSEEMKSLKENVGDLKSELETIHKKQEEVHNDMEELKDMQKNINDKIDSLNKKIEKISEKQQELQEKLEECCDEGKHMGPSGASSGTPSGVSSGGPSGGLSGGVSGGLSGGSLPRGLDDELDVNFSDMRQSMKDIADERAYNEDSMEYVELLQNKNTKFGKMLVAAKQAMLGDYFRMKKYRSKFKAMDNAKSGLNVRGDWANIAKVHGGQGLNTVMELTQENHPIVYQQISNLALEYYEGGSTMTDTEFERRLKDIFASRDAESLVSELESSGVSIDKSASDILQSLQIQKAQNTLTYQVGEAVANALGTKSSLGVAEADALAANISGLFTKFTKDNKLVPQLFGHYNKLVQPADQINLNDTYKNISKKMVAHLDSLTMVAAQSMTNRVKLNIKFLADGHSVDHIEAKKGEKQSRWNPVVKLGGIMYGKGYRWRRFPTKVLTTGGTAALGAVIFGPLGGIVAGSIVAGSLAAGKKAAQTKRKKHSIEKEYIKDRDNNINRMNQKDLMELKYLDDIGNYNEIKSAVEKILAQPVMSDKDKNDLVGLLSRIIAGLDYQKESGHNAFSLKKRVSTSRPEIDETTREKNYNEAMSDLYKLKELSLKRLQLQDTNLTEDDIRNEDQYDGYLSGYKGDFKKFLKLFKKERTKEMRKTGGRTAAIYGAIGGVTLGLAHFLDWIGGDAGVDIDVSDTADTGDVADVVTPGTTLPVGSIEDLGDVSTLYDLGKFESSSDFSKDIADQLSQMSSNSGTLKVDYFAGVDGTPASASSFTIGMVENKASEIENILNSGSFSQETIDNVRQVISDDNIKELIKFAESNGADAGNKNLFALRNLEGIEELLKQVDGKTEINLEFNFNESNSIIGDTSYVPKDRMTGIDLEAIVEKTPDGDIPDTPEGPTPNPGTKSGTSWRGGQGIYTEDNSHKGQDNI